MSDTTVTEFLVRIFSKQKKNNWSNQGESNSETTVSASMVMIYSIKKKTRGSNQFIKGSKCPPRRSPSPWLESSVKKKRED